VVLALAIVRAGKCLVPLAAELAAPERARLIRDTRLGAIVNATGTIKELELEPVGDFPEEELAALNPAFIRFSSGTTGSSKGVVLSHERLLERITAANRGLRISPSDRVLWLLPMAHHFAVSILLYLLHGATTIIATSLLAEDLLTSAREHGATVVYGSPLHHALLAAEASDRAWPTLRLAVSTAAALPVHTAEAFDRRFGVALSQGLGIIEVGLPLLNLQAARSKPKSVGRPLPDFQFKLGADGELFLRGPGLLDAYLSPWQPSHRLLENGWFRTGDLARMDEDGDLHLLGRASSVINVAGLKCFPEEVEAVLGQLPEVRAVRVFGEAHARVGSVPIAEIVPSDPIAPPAVVALAKHCRQALARYKVPVEFRFVDKLPLTASGKVRRAVVAPAAEQS
jgi:long-chain acyl-CoA synthetase